MTFLKNIEVLNPTSSSKYPYSIPLFSNGLQISLNSPVSFIVGENGTGKSTLLESIALECGFNTMGGSKNHVYGTMETKAVLKLKLSWFPKVHNGFFMRAESFYNFASHLEQESKDWGKQVYKGYGGASLHKQSHGEAFMSLFTNRFTSKNKQIFILDEPEAALSPTRQLSFLNLLHQLTVDNNAQFIIATHSPILLAYPNATIYEIENDNIQTKQWQELEHVTITKDFLNNPSVFLKHLL